MKHLELKKIVEKYDITLGMIVAILSGRGWGKSEKVKEICLDDFERGLGRFEWVVNSEDSLKEEKDNFLDGLKRRQNDEGEKFLFDINNYVMDGLKILKIIKVPTGKVNENGDEEYKEEKILAGKLKLLAHLAVKGSRTRIANYVYDEFNDGVPRIHKNFQFKWWWKRLITLTEGEFAPRIWLMGNNENHNTEIGIKLGLSKMEDGISFDGEMLSIKDSRDMAELFGGESSGVVKLAKRFGVYESTFSTEYAGIERLNVVNLKLENFKFVIGFSSNKDDDSFIISIYNGVIGNENIYYAVSEEYREVRTDKNRGERWISNNIISVSKNKGNDDFKVISDKARNTFRETFRKLSNEGKMYYKYERCRNLFTDEIFK